MVVDSHTENHVSTGLVKADRKNWNKSKTGQNAVLILHSKKTELW